MRRRARSADPDGQSVNPGAYSKSGIFGLSAGNHIICAYLFANTTPAGGPADAVDSEVSRSATRRQWDRSA